MLFSNNISDLGEKMARPLFLMLCVIASNSLPRHFCHFAAKIYCIGPLRIPSAIVILQCDGRGRGWWNDKKHFYGKAENLQEDEKVWCKLVPVWVSMNADRCNMFAGCFSLSFFFLEGNLQSNNNKGKFHSNCHCLAQRTYWRVSSEAKRQWEEFYPSCFSSIPTLIQ